MGKTKYIDADRLIETLNKEKVPFNDDVNYFILNAPAADVIELNAFRNEVYRYIAANKDEDANFLSGLETAVVIAEKMAGVYEEVEE